MGYWGNLRIEEAEQGWHFSNRWICIRCVSDPYLKNTIRNEGMDSDCSFCGEYSSLTASFDSVMKIVASTILQYYNYAENEAPWDSEERGFIGDTFDAYDLVHEHLIWLNDGVLSDNDSVLQGIADSLVGGFWCRRDMYGTDPVDDYMEGWDYFCDLVKHRVRYFFNLPTDAPALPRLEPIHPMLDQLGEMISDFDLVRTLGQSEEFFRVRVHSRAKVCDSWKSLGSPPDAAAASNRMSAAGVSMFYAALDMATARAEVSANKSNRRDILTGARWTSTRPLKVLDLTALPALPSIFSMLRSRRDALAFLRRFVEEIMRPVEHDGRERIDYVPTQVLTEYFRHHLMSKGTERIDGIVYPSARRKNGRSIAVFASQRELDPSCPDDTRKPVLVLDQSSVRRVRRFPQRRTPVFSPGALATPPQP